MSVNRDIYELQQDATQERVGLTVLLRRALVLARAKNDAVQEQWIRNELDGYAGPSREIPDYRRVHGEPRAWNPYRGWIPIQFEDSRQANVLSERLCGQSVPEIEKLVSSPTSDQLHMPIPSEIAADLNRSSTFPFPTKFTLFIPSTSLHRILAGVRSRLLDWTMQFDLDGCQPKEGRAAMDMRAMRFQFLAALHDMVDGDRHNIVNMFDVGKSLGFDQKTTERIVQFLTGEFLVEHMTLGGGIVITHHGVREVEDARSQPTASTEYFPPSGSVPVPPASVTNIVNNYGSMGSVQQAGSDSTQEITHDERGKILSVLEQVKGAVAAATLDPTFQGDVEAQVGTVEAQLKASKPKMNIVRGCLESLKGILESAAGQALGAAVPGILRGLGAILGG